MELTLLGQHCSQVALLHYNDGLSRQMMLAEAVSQTLNCRFAFHDAIDAILDSCDSSVMKINVLQVLQSLD